MNASTGLELVVNACEGVLQIVLSEDEKLLVAQEWALPQRETEILVPALQQIFALSRRKIAHLRRLACVRGPGSFTGIRLVLSTAAALRRTTKVQLAPVNYLQALATTVAMREHLRYGRQIWVMTHARRDLIHCCHFRCFGEVIPAYPIEEEIRLISFWDALADICMEGMGQKDPIYICGSALSRSKELLDGLQEVERRGLCVLRKDLTRPSVEALMLLGRHGDYEKKDIEPLYVRPCDAVENLPDLAERMGYDPEASVQKLEALLQQEPKSEI